MVDKHSPIGVIGAGQMGSGIAQICAANGYQVIIVDTLPDGLNKAKSQITKSLEKFVHQGNITAVAKSEILARMSTTTELEAIKGCKLIIEAVPESESIKKSILSQLPALLSHDAVVCSNTSSLSITQLGGFYTRPQKLVGLHFMNPVPIMPLVELIRGLATDDHAVETAFEFATSLGKTVVECHDSPGFVVNRLLIPMINEAIFLLYEGVASTEDIDEAMRLGTSHPMGPLELADLIGLDTCLAIMKRLYEGFHDPKYRPCPLLTQYVDAGLLGRKTQKGFYDYTVNQA
ncbi:MAG: NAD(P)-binding domain-containing protein [Alphaproteobacteria bacterium]|nr:NAD(P)-binding domain-containing protein [Alphaproteobacteria bacterium]OJV45684.1 MAG: 3-hydroxybutyryl-CoA dehydrogenase [Alphaproteobacteria bacterium 43-37]